MQNENTKSIVATNLYDMLLEVQAAVKQGFVISDKNSDYPQSFIGLYTCTMVQDVAKEETNVATQETPSKLPTEPSTAILNAEVTHCITTGDKAVVEGMRSVTDKVEPQKQVTKRGRK